MITPSHINLLNAAEKKEADDLEALIDKLLDKNRGFADLPIKQKDQVRNHYVWAEVVARYNDAGWDVHLVNKDKEYVLIIRHKRLAILAP
jgi:hypothetical protein